MPAAEPGRRTRKKAKASAPRRVSKLSVSFAAEDEAWLRRRAKLEGRPFSAVLKDAVGEARRVEAQRELVRWLEEKSGPTTADEIEAVRREWREAKARPD